MGQVAYLRAACGRYRAGVGLERARRDFEQRALARAVRADNADAPAFADVKRYVVKYRRVYERFGYVFKRYYVQCRYLVNSIVRARAPEWFVGAKAG